MDQIDKKIAFYLLKNGRMQMREIAKRAGISAQALNYRYSKLLENGIIKRYSLRLNPSLIGKVNVFAAFKNDAYKSENVISKFKCLEEITIYEFIANSVEEAQNCIETASAQIGKPFMQYIPEQERIPINLGDIDRGIINLLRTDPRMSVVSMAAQLDVKPSIVRKRLNLMEKYHVLTVTAELDLSKMDSIIFAVISDNLKSLSSYIDEDLIITISDRGRGIMICYSDNLRNARKVIERMRVYDPSADVMVVYDYEFS